MFALIKEIRYFNKKIIGFKIIGYSSNEQLLIDKANEHNVDYEDKLKNFIPYNQRYDEYDISNPPPKLSSFQDANPGMDIPTAVGCFEEIYQNWFATKLKTVGKPENEPVFEFFLVQKIQEIT